MKQLKDYQTQAIAFLDSVSHAGLFIDMGLGKTAATLHSVKNMPRPILLVGPIRVIETVWETEAKSWKATQELTFSLLRGKPQERLEALKTPADVYMVNPELMPEILEQKKFATLIIDESSMFKNPSTKRFKNLRKKLVGFKKRVILTGTPSPTSLLNLWSQIFILDLGERLGTSYHQFRDRFFNQDDYMGYSFSPKPGALEDITQLVSDIIFRVEKLKPSEAIHNKIPIPLPIEAKKHYRTMEKEAFAQLMKEDIISAPNAAAASMKLRQIASGFIYDEMGQATTIHQEKLKVVESILAETGSPVLLVYQFKEELKALQKAFSQGVVFDSKEVDKWNKGQIPLMFIHPQNGGHGVNLQYGGHTMIIFSASYSLEYMSQVMARIDRQGQESVVIFHWLLALDTIDELILEVLESRETDQKNVLAKIKKYAESRLKD